MRASLLLFVALTAGCANHPSLAERLGPPPSGPPGPVLILAPAKASYEAILARQPRHPAALQLLGVLAHQSGDTERAIALIEEALAVAPN